MAKYRKKPVVVEAFQYNGDLMGRNGKFYVPDWAEKACEEGILFYGNGTREKAPWELYIKTLKGILFVNVGDYVIQGVKGEIYSCKPDIFEMTYNKVD